MNQRSKIILLVVLVVVLIGTTVAYFYFNPPAILTNRPSESFLKDKPQNLEKKDEIWKDLPAGASTVRINLPTSISNLMISQKKGLGGLGVETDDPAVYDFVWLDIKTGTEIKAIASGKVTKINQKGFMEYEVIVNHSYGLWGRYQGLKKIMVKEDELVREGQAIGLGMGGSQPSSDILALSLADENLKEGTKSSFSPGVLVKPLDYLKPDVKAIILQKYK